MTLKEYEVQKALGLISYDRKLKIARDPNTSIEILKTLYKEAPPYSDFIRMVVANPNFSFDKFEMKELEEITKNGSAEDRLKAFWLLDAKKTGIG